MLNRSLSAKPDSRKNTEVAWRNSRISRSNPISSVAPTAPTRSSHASCANLSALRKLASFGFVFAKNWLEIGFRTAPISKRTEPDIGKLPELWQSAAELVAQGKKWQISEFRGFWMLRAACRVPCPVEYAVTMPVRRPEKQNHSATDENG
jgi:hypothetical protein